MPTLVIGQKEIPYELRRSATATERRITVTPGRVEVMVLTEDGDDCVADFLHRKRRWIFDAVRELEQIAEKRHDVPRFMTGSKIPFRGRLMPLTVRRTSGAHLDISYRNGFLVDLPAWAASDTDCLVATELKLWLKRSVRRDVAQLTKRYTKNFGLKPRSVRVGDMLGGWGSCGPEGNVLINWHLVFAPRKVLDYVIAHELAHLRHRTHSRVFWSFLATIRPDFENAKAWLEEHQASLSADFLSA